MCGFLSLTNIELIINRYVHLEVLNMSTILGDDQSAGKLSRREPEWVVRHVVQLKFSMGPEREDKRNSTLHAKSQYLKMCPPDYNIIVLLILGPDNSQSPTGTKPTVDEGIGVEVGEQNMDKDLCALGLRRTIKVHVGPPAVKLRVNDIVRLSERLGR